MDDAKVRVIEVAVDKLAHGSRPEEMHFQYPHLSLSQIHAVLAYYYDHQDEMDAEIFAAVGAGQRACGSHFGPGSQEEANRGKDAPVSVKLLL
ncbi:MAG TPA: DUF433 domain-containing protein [Blastocatellia bacterium]|nr:DUF433 domain-containing protein [Blastocatellia bacterium]